jgi:hypothetical protein
LSTKYPDGDTGKVDTANAMLAGLKTQLRLTEEQITGGDGYPVALVITQFPDTDNSFALQASVSGKAPLFDVSYGIGEGAYNRPTAAEVQKMVQENAAQLNGHGTNQSHFLGVLNPGYLVSDGLHDSSFHSRN